MSSKSQSTSERITAALATACRLIGAAPPDRDTAAAMRDALARYPEELALLAIARAGRELRGRLTLADLLERLDDGRPGPEEAWGTVGSADERRSYVTTTEAMQALSEARMLLKLGDGVAGRMAFIESYRRIVSVNRAKGLPVEMHVSLGTDPGGREAAVLHALERGRIDRARAAAVLGVAEAALPAPLRALPAERPALPPPAPCEEGWCDGAWHYADDPETVRRPGVTACPRRRAA